MAKNNHLSIFDPGFSLSSVGSGYNGGVPQLLQQSKLSPSSNSCDHGVLSKNFVIPAPSEKIEMFSPAYYLACTAGGVFSCGLTHMTVTPLDLVKCNMQIDPSKYKSITSGFGVLLKSREQEILQEIHSDMRPENAAKYKTLIYLAGSASAELIADVALCPMEAVKVRVQTQPGFARAWQMACLSFSDLKVILGMTLAQQIFCVEIIWLYKGLVPLWGRQIPYTMMKFASRDYCEQLYKNVIQHQKTSAAKICSLESALLVDILLAVRQLGLWGLFTRGLPLRIVMIGTLTGAQWGIYDAFKVFVGLPTTGGGAPAPAVAKP
uniref:Uncharacterized protein n=1 Tax=Salix viminalis TaxID=40686 RepID=A0A6N2MFB3_SALVM